MQLPKLSGKRDCERHPHPLSVFDTKGYSAPIDINPAPQFKLDIKNAPIQEEDGDPNAAMADMANTLRAVCVDPTPIHHV